MASLITCRLPLHVAHTRVSRPRRRAAVVAAAAPRAQPLTTAVESAPVAAAALLALSPARAAEDADAGAAAAAASAAAAAAAETEVVLPPPDLLTSGLFITAAVLLVVVTAGVAYLSLMDLNDKRIEAEEREKLEKQMRVSARSGAPASPSKEAWQAPQRITDPARAAAKAKGFGAAAKQAASQLSGEQKSE